MSRRAARITHDEVTRMVKAIRDLGLPIGVVKFDGSELAVVIGNDFQHKVEPALMQAAPIKRIREPRL